MNLIGIILLFIPVVLSSNSSNITNTSFFTSIEDFFMRYDPSDLSFKYIHTYCRRGEFRMIDANGNEACHPCNLDFFRNRYKQINLNVTLKYRHANCILNPHHHVCKELIVEFMKCSKWSSVCPKKDDIQKLEPTPFVPPPVIEIVNKTCTYYRFTQYLMSVDMAQRCNCDKNKVQQDINDKWMVGPECTGYPTTLD